MQMKSCPILLNLLALIFCSLGNATGTNSPVIQISEFTNHLLRVRISQSETLPGVLRLVGNQHFLALPSSETSLRIAGMCFSNKAVCKTVSNLRDLYSKALAQNYGRFNIDPALRFQLDKLPKTRVEYQTHVLSFSDTELLAEVEYIVAGTKSVTKVSISHDPSFRRETIILSEINKDYSDRRGIARVSNIERMLAQSVFRLNFDEEIEDSQLGNNGGWGTGFFLTNDGLALTNNHVISSDTKCIRNLLCRIKISTVDKFGRFTETEVPAHLLTAHAGYDIAILKLDLPSDLQVLPLKLEKKQIGQDLLTLGFPGDRDKGPEGSLTFSYGVITGFYERTFATSIYTNAGASGSPVVNTNDLSVIGIVSNVLGSEDYPGSGMTTIVRPINFIDNFFDITGYADGSKEKRVNKLIASLEDAIYFDASLDILNKLRNERTFIGLDRLLKLASQHPSVDVRVEIIKYLSDVGSLIAR